MTATRSISKDKSQSNCTPEDGAEVIRLALEIRDWLKTHSTVRPEAA